jgi:hypothetical protein
MANKDIERAYLELARSIHPEFPAGDPVDSESPDFLWSNGALGLEVRRLFQIPPPAGFPPSQVDGFQQTVIRQAEKLYRDAGGPPADVIVNFSGRDRNPQRASDLARAVAGFVRDHRRCDRQVTFYEAGDLDIPIPPGLTGINIASPLPGPPRAWAGGGVGQTILVSHALLDQAIKEKGARVASYRAKSSEVWLLIVCDLFPASMSFAVPDDIGEWEFTFAFDKILFLSRADMKVWPLRRAQPCRAALLSPPSAEPSMKPEPDPQP